MTINRLGKALIVSFALVAAARAQGVQQPIVVSSQPQLLASLKPADANGAAPLYPSQLQTAYGVNNVIAAGNSGAGQTIAIVDAYDYPDAIAAANGFSSIFGLPQFNSGAGSPTFTQLNETGGTALPGTDPAGAGFSGNNWEVEEALDIEWAHTMAPMANIILYEATNNDSDGLPHLETAVNTARNNPNVSVISMSWSAGESSDEASEDSLFTTPSARLAAKQGVSFVAATGDSGAPGGYPAFSPNVVAMGGTSLTLNADNTYQSESAWGNGASSGSLGGGGGGVSQYEPKPWWQNGVTNLQGVANRATPDVAMDADPASGVYVYDPYNLGPDYVWVGVGGTSLATPLFAGILADADGLRSSMGYGTLDGPTELLPALYSLTDDFHDVTTGNNGFAAGPGYDLATGLGSPIADELVPDLAAYGVPEPSTLALLGIGGAAGLVFSRRRDKRRILA